MQFLKMYEMKAMWPIYVYIVLIGEISAPWSTLT